MELCLLRRVEADEITDDDALHGSHLGTLFGAAQSGTETHEEWRRGEIAHGGVGDGEIFKQCAVYRFERVSQTTFEDAVGNRDVDEAAVRFRAALDPASTGNVKVWCEFLESAVQHGAKFVIASHPAICDGEVSRRACIAQGKARFRADAIVPRRVDCAIGYTNVLATVDVDAITIGIDLEVVDGQLSTPVRRRPKWPALRIEKSRKRTL